MKIKAMEYMTLTNVAYLFILLGGIAGIVLAIEQASGSKQDKEDIIKTLNTEVSSLREERNKLNKDLKKRDKSIKKQNDKIEDLNLEIFEQSKFIKQYISGGDGFPLIEVKKISDLNNNSNFTLLVTNTYDLPIYNLEIEAFIYNKLELKTFQVQNDDVKSIKIDDYNENRILNYNKSVLSPKSSNFTEVTLKSEGNLLHFKIITQNRKLSQNLVILKKENFFYIYTVIFDIVKNKKIFEKFNREYPINIQKELKELESKMPRELILNMYK
jgi:hypothetical protein